LKVHHFDLSNIIQDVSLLADSSSLDANRALRKLSIRAKFQKAGKLNPMKDLRIYLHFTRGQVESLTNSLEKLNAILENL